MAAASTAKIAAQASLIDAHAQARASLSGAKWPWVDAARTDAIEQFAHWGLPTPRVEAWKFTNLAPLGDIEFRPAAAANANEPAVDPKAFALADSHLAVFVDGRFSPGLSDLVGLPEGAGVTSLAAELAAGSPRLRPYLSVWRSHRDAALVALNGAFMSDGAIVRLAAGAKLDRPLHLLFIGAGNGSPSLLCPRNIVEAEPGSAATIVETYVGLGGVYWTNVVTRVSIGAGARLNHCRMQAEAGDAFHVGASEIRLAADAAYESFAMATGGRLARNDIDIEFAGRGARCRLDGLTLARGRQHLDSTTRIDHAHGHCVSEQVYRAVVDDEAHSVFQGRIRVAPHAQKTDARQLNRNLLLADGAQADSKPELEILADDVKCSHGAAVGDLDHQSLFYLRSRGMDEAAARAMLIAAFGAEAIDAIGHEGVRAHCRAALQTWLGGGNG